MSLKQSGVMITGVAGESEGKNWEILNGKTDGDKITFDVQQPNGPLVKFDLVLVEGHIKGGAKAEKDGMTMTAKVDVMRKAD